MININLCVFLIVIMGTLFSSRKTSIDNFTNALIFHPPQRHPSEIDNLNEGISKVIYLPSKSGNVSVNIITPRTFSKKYLIFSHGNAGDIVSMNPYMVALSKKLGVVGVSYDYFGYGASQGKPTEEGCYKSLATVVRYVEAELKAPLSDIYLMGQSLGTGVTFDYASKRTWTTPIILVSPYKTIARVLSDSSLMSSSKSIDKFENMDKVDDVTCPVKIFHGDADTLINITHGKYLFDHIRNKKFKPTWMKGVGHNDILERIETNDLWDIIYSS